MLRFFLVCALSVNVASAQESASQPSSMPTSAPSSLSQCEGCFAPAPSLSPPLYVDATLSTEPLKDESAPRLHRFSKKLAWASAVTLGTAGLLSTFDGGDVYTGVLITTGMTSALALNVAASTRAIARYRGDGKPLSTLRRQSLVFFAASALQVSTFLLASEALTGPSNDDEEPDAGISFTTGQAFIGTSLAVGSLSSMALSVGFLMRGAQERISMNIAKEEEETRAEEHPTKTRARSGKGINRASSILVKTTLGLGAASFVMFPLQDEREDFGNPGAVVYQFTSGAALTASSAAVISYGLYRHQKTKRPASIYAMAGLSAAQLGLRVMAAVAFDNLSKRDGEFGPSGDYLTSGVSYYATGVAFVSTSLLLGKALLETTKAQIKERANKAQ